MKGKATRKQSLHEKTAASVLLKLFISSQVLPTLFRMHDHTYYCYCLKIKTSKRFGLVYRWWKFLWRRNTANFILLTFNAKTDNTHSIGGQRTDTSHSIGGHRTDTTHSIGGQRTDTTHSIGGQRTDTTHSIGGHWSGLIPHILLVDIGADWYHTFYWWTLTSGPLYQ